MSTLLHRAEVPAPRRAIAAEVGPKVTGGLAYVLAVTRYAVGFIFLWAFLDKLFGWGYATPSERAWINDGSPTKGFLSNVAVGPFESTFNGWAGDAWADWLFMLALVGVGVAVILGVGMRLAAVSGTILMLFMWVAEWPLAKHTSAGELSGSTNPIVDYHIIYALALIVLAVAGAGRTWGFGKIWAKIPFVKRNPWLI